jgi:hypothetical protein
MLFFALVISCFFLTACAARVRDEVSSTDRDPRKETSDAAETDTDTDTTDASDNQTDTDTERRTDSLDTAVVIEIPPDTGTAPSTDTVIDAGPSSATDSDSGSDINPETDHRGDTDIPSERETESHPGTDSAQDSDSGEWRTDPDGESDSDLDSGLPSPCDDENPCTYDDHYDGKGDCVGIEIACVDDPHDCGARRACNGTPMCDITYPDASISCDDDDPCTFKDHCNGAGGCASTPIFCKDDPAVCGAVRACNGTSECTHAFPDDETGCDDGDACTYDDACDGKGGCAGIPIACEDDPEVCGAKRACNHTDTCVVAFPGSETPCDDGNVYTTDDACDGRGACKGADYRATHAVWKVSPTHVPGPSDFYPTCYGNDTTPIFCPAFPCLSDGSPDFCGQDAHYPDNYRTFTIYDIYEGDLKICDNQVYDDDTDSATDHDTGDDTVDDTDDTPDQIVVDEDSLSTLVWQRPFAENLTWPEAIAYCETLCYANQWDWRLPSRAELMRLVDYGQWAPAIDARMFPDTLWEDDISFWSSNAAVADSTKAWAVNFDNGLGKTSLKATANAVRCVRGDLWGQNHLDRFAAVERLNEIVIWDRITKLAWAKTVSENRIWMGALRYCEALDYAGYDDWRLPNINELRSLVNINRCDPATDFPEMPQAFFWSSTTFSDTPGAWTVNFANGGTYGAPKESSSLLYSARCVRGGP